MYSEDYFQMNPFDMSVVMNLGAWKCGYVLWNGE